MFFFFAQKILNLKRFFSASSLWLYQNRIDQHKMVASFFSALLYSGSFVLRLYQKVHSKAQCFSAQTFQIHIDICLFLLSDSLEVRAIPRIFCSILSSSGSQSSQKTYCPHDVFSGLSSVQSQHLTPDGSAVSASSLWLYKQTTGSLSHGLLLSLSKTGPIKYLKHTEERPCSLSFFVVQN